MFTPPAFFLKYFLFHEKNKTDGFPNSPVPPWICICSCSIQPGPRDQTWLGGFFVNQISHSIIWYEPFYNLILIWNLYNLKSAYTNTFKIHKYTNTQTSLWCFQCTASPLRHTGWRDLPLCHCGASSSSIIVVYHHPDVICHHYGHDPIITSNTYMSQWGSEEGKREGSQVPWLPPYYHHIYKKRL